MHHPVTMNIGLSTQIRLNMSIKQDHLAQSYCPWIA